MCTKVLKQIIDKLDEKTINAVEEHRILFSRRMFFVVAFIDKKLLSFRQNTGRLEVLRQE